jgi:pimeloyl-ACP methyl ester carboxylesterase
MRSATIDIVLGDGRTLHAYDTGSPAADPLVVFWHHGTPNIGAPPEPLLAHASAQGIRWVSHDRPGYGGSTPDRGRDLAAVAADVATIADALGVESFAVVGHSGGASHALACAALLPERVLGAVCVAALAPLGADGLDWFAGMAAAGEADLRSAVAGREALARHLASSEFDPELFTAADHAALAGRWGWLGEVAEAAMAGGPEGAIEDDLAYVAPWRFALEEVGAPVLIVHGERDRVVPSAHGSWIADRCPAAELWLRPEDGHLSVLQSAEAAIDWLTVRARPQSKTPSAVRQRGAINP